jgi:phosphotransferase system  glucose/maltose/N-acetylglucosamine-specific IIC component
MITMATYGLGLWIGSVLSGYVAKQATINTDRHHWDAIWIVPIAITVAVLVFFVFSFKEGRRQPALNT